MVVVWKSLQKAIHKRRTSNNRASPGARLDDASASVVEREELDELEDERTEPSTTAKTERSRKDWPFSD